MSKTKSSGVTRLGRDSNPKYLGIKLYAGQKAQNGSIIVRQRGSKFTPGKNVRKGGDDTIYSVKEGVVNYVTTSKKCFNGSKRLIKVVNVEPVAETKK